MSACISVAYWEKKVIFYSGHGHDTTLSLLTSHQISDRMRQSAKDDGVLMFST